jgi:hypothetical protein
MFNGPNQSLLRALAMRGEMSAREFLAMVPRKTLGHTDFYGVAALLHGGFVSTDTTWGVGKLEGRGTLAEDMLNTAVHLCQMTLKKGESFSLHGCPRDAWDPSDVSFFVTPQGLLKLEELDAKTANDKERRFDRWYAFGLAIVAAVAGGWASNWFK